MAALQALATRGITRLMVEGGPILAGALLRADLIDEAVLFRSSNVIGADGIDPLDGLPLAALTRSPRLFAIGSEMIGADSVETFDGPDVFTGIVTDIGEVIAVEPRAEGLARLNIACGYDPDTIGIGASIACSGVCLTVVARGRDASRGWFAVDAAAETLRLTTVGRWHSGSRVNLERPLKVGDELGGHLVAGHADGLAGLTMREDLAEMARLTFRVPAGLARFVAVKGSVAIDGVSLTVNEVAGTSFTVLIIPHTLEVTTIGALATGDEVNFEVDLMARYAARLMERHGK